MLHAQNSTRGFLYLINKEPTFVICFGEGGFELVLVGGAVELRSGSGGSCTTCCSCASCSGCGGGGADMYTLDPLSFVLELSAQET